MAGGEEVYVMAGKRTLLVGVLAVVQMMMAQQPDAALRIEAAAAPRYPLVAYTSRTEGRVEVDVEIDRNGAVVHAKSLNGPYELRPASEKAALGWRFQKASAEGVRKTLLTFRFVLSKAQPTGLSAVFRSPFEIEVIGEEEKTEIFADPPVDVLPSSKPKKK
jgi:hypothetical protein